MPKEDKEKILKYFFNKPYSIEEICLLMKNKYTYREVQQVIQEQYK